MLKLVSCETLLQTIQENGDESKASFHFAKQANLLGFIFFLTFFYIMHLNRFKMKQRFFHVF